MALPKVRVDLIVSELDGEALVYDFSSHRAHCLNPTAKAVFARCDGRTNAAQIARAVGADLGVTLTEELVHVALDELAAAGLLEVSPRRRFVDQARRRVLGQLALSAGLSVALPAVWSIVAPTRADAASRVSCIPAASCMAVSSGTCCGTVGSPAMSCSGVGMCTGTGAGCNGAQCI